MSNLLNFEAFRKIKMLEKEAKKLQESTTIINNKEEQIKLLRLNAQIKIAKLSRNA
jgi:methyl-accepting chemotaxis protein